MSTGSIGGLRQDDVIAMPRKAWDWLRSDECGLSSECIFAVMLSLPAMTDGFYPRDPGDFGRCRGLLAIFPEWRARLPEVAARFPEWAGLVAAWDELDALYERESHNEDGLAPLLYARIQELTR